MAQCSYKLVSCALSEKITPLNDCVHSVGRHYLHCCMIDSQSYGDSKISRGSWRRGSELQNPWTDWQKIWRGYYASDDSSHARTKNDCPIGGMAAYAWNINLAWFLVFLSYPFFVTPNFARLPRLNRRTDFYAVCFIWRQFLVTAFLAVARDVVEMTPPTTTMHGKFGSEVETWISCNAPFHFRHRQTDGQTDGHWHRA